MIKTDTLIIGAGPIIIGQACEFDYSGTQACQALREEGYRVILINSNPATIMTDINIADATYLEPIEINAIEKIIIKEKPDAILPTVGGQTALDMAMQLDKKGILKKYKIKLIGANIQSIETAENREKFKDEKNLTRPKHWSGWCLNTSSIEFWLGEGYRINERLRYNKVSKIWKKEILYP